MKNNLQLSPNNNNKNAYINTFVNTLNNNNSNNNRRNQTIISIYGNTIIYCIFRSDFG